MRVVGFDRNGDGCARVSLPLLLSGGAAARRGGDVVRALVACAVRARMYARMRVSLWCAGAVRVLSVCECVVCVRTVRLSMMSGIVSDAIALVQCVPQS